MKTSHSDPQLKRNSLNTYCCEKCFKQKLYSEFYTSYPIHLLCKPWIMRYWNKWLLCYAYFETCIFSSHQWSSEDVKITHIYYTGRFIMFSVITNIYKKETLMELFTATGKLKKFFW